MFFQLKPLTSTGYCSARRVRISPEEIEWTQEDNPFLPLSFADRAHIARLCFPSFNPAGVGEPSDEVKSKYTEAWWKEYAQYTDSRNRSRDGDVSYFIANACMFPARSQEDWVPVSYEAPLDFYCTVCESNALTWYLACPLHLRKQVDKEVAQLTRAEVAKPGEPLYESTKLLWGDRPVLKRVTDGDAKGELMSTYLELEWLKQWVWEYERLALIRTCIAMAPGMQKERKMLSEALGLNKTAGLPSQAEGLTDDVQGATVRWLQAQGQTPLEFLVETYKDDENKMGDRIQAAKTLMDYVHRKITTKQEIEHTPNATPKLAPESLRGLSEKELETLEKLLNKLGN